MKRTLAIVNRALVAIITVAMTIGLVQPVMAAEPPAAGNDGAVMMESVGTPEEAEEPDGGEGGGISAGEETPTGTEAAVGVEDRQDGSDAGAEPGSDAADNDAAESHNAGETPEASVAGETGGESVTEAKDSGDATEAGYSDSVAEVVTATTVIEETAPETEAEREAKEASPEEASTAEREVTYGQTEARKMLSLVNDFRKPENAWYYDLNGKKVWQKDLAGLKYDYDLEQAAMKRAAELAFKFGHTRPDGSGFFTAVPGDAKAYGENIAAGTGDYKSVFAAWQETNKSYNDQGDRRNMLSAGFNCIGIGHAAVNGVHYWVQEFGYREDINTTKTTASESPETVVVGKLATPKLTGVASISSGVSVSWAEVPGAVRYRVLRKKRSGEWSSIGLTTGNSYVDRTAVNGTLYSYTVCAVTSGGAKASEYNTIGLTAVYMTRPEIRELANPMPGRVTVSWNMNMSCTGYQVQYTSNSKFASFKTATVPAGNIPGRTLTGLVKGRTYYVRMRTYKKVGTKTYYTGWSKVRKVKVAR